MTRLLSLAIVALAACLVLPVLGQEKAGEVSLRVVKYDGLKEEVLKNRGKVVLVDFWGDFCTPCKIAFPHTVELHRKYEAKGLAVISVALDSLDENPSQVKDRVLAFLKKQKATFPNLLLDESLDFWTKKFRMDGPPCMYVFSRQGKWTQLSADELETPAKLDRLIEDLLAEK